MTLKSSLFVKKDYNSCQYRSKAITGFVRRGFEVVDGVDCVDVGRCVVSVDVVVAVVVGGAVLTRKVFWMKSGKASGIKVTLFRSDPDFFLPFHLPYGVIA